jgi:hypothetical protein
MSDRRGFTSMEVLDILNGTTHTELGRTLAKLNNSESNEKDWRQPLEADASIDGSTP